MSVGICARVEGDSGFAKCGRTMCSLSKLKEEGEHVERRGPLSAIL